jgi:NADPH-dependent ferric siderophore reductase
MLDDDGHGNWDAVYDLSELWGSEETPSREMSYYERMLAVGQLPLEFPVYDPDAAGSRWAADARRLHESRGQR